MTDIINDRIAPVHGKLWDLQTHGLTQSMLSTFLTCPQKMYNAYVLGLVPDSPYTYPLEFGNIVHRNLELTYGTYRDDLRKLTDPSVVWSQHLDDAELTARREAFEGNATAAELDRLYETYGICAAVLKGYYPFWKADFNEIDWVELEQEFCVPYNTREGAANGIVFNIPLRGKIDGVIRRKHPTTGKEEYWIIDHKTKSRIDEDGIIDRLAFDLQVGVYMWAAEQLYGIRPAGIVYNLIRRPQLRKKVTEDSTTFAKRVASDVYDRDTWYFNRYEVRMNDRDVEVWRQDFNAMLSRLINWYYGTAPTYKDSTSCYTGWSPCTYLRACSVGDTINFMTRKRLFPELDFESKGVLEGAKKD